MSLRYGHLFDTTIRAEYERALDLAKNRIGALPQPANTATAEPAATWMTGPTIKTALASGYCLRAPAQQACTYANICEHCPSFHRSTRRPASPRRSRGDASRPGSCSQPTSRPPAGSSRLHGGRGAAAGRLRGSLSGQPR